MGVKCQTPETVAGAWDANMHHFVLYTFQYSTRPHYSGLDSKWSQMWDMFQLCTKKRLSHLSFKRCPLPPLGNVLKACPWNVKYKRQQGKTRISKGLQNIKWKLLYCKYSAAVMLIGIFSVGCSLFSYDYMEINVHSQNTETCICTFINDGTLHILYDV